MFTKKHLAGLLAAVTLLPAAAGAATPDDPIIAKMTAGDVMSVMQGMGFGAYIEADSEGDPMIVANGERGRFGIVFYDCEKNGPMAGRACADMEIFAVYELKRKPSLAALNDWNKANAFGKGYIMDDGDVIVEMPVNLAKGVNTGYLRSTLEWWNAVQAGFEKHIGR